jgi:hypothetical protein
LIALPLAFLAICLGIASPGQAGPQFEGELVLKVLPDGRLMELIQPFGYVDSSGIRWPIPKGTKVDGASIPSVLWSLIGAPYTGKYREASVIHDYYCQARNRHWKAVHRVFLDGMKANGVDELKAQIMYIAVYRFGPRWDFDADACFCKGCPKCAHPKFKRINNYRPSLDVDNLNELVGQLKAGSLNLEEAEQFADFQINTKIFKP